MKRQKRFMKKRGKLKGFCERRLDSDRIAAQGLLKPQEVRKLWLELLEKKAARSALPREGRWIETPAGEPVIDRGPSGAWDHYAVDNPFVLAGKVFRAVREDDNDRSHEHNCTITPPVVEVARVDPSV